MNATNYCKVMQLTTLRRQNGIEVWETHYIVVEIATMDELKSFQREDDARIYCRQMNQLVQEETVVLT